MRNGDNSKKKCSIRERSGLFDLPTMHPYSSFPHDVKHTFYNSQNQLLAITVGSYNDGFSIDRSAAQNLDDELLEWEWGISEALA